MQAKPKWAAASSAQAPAAPEQEAKQEEVPEKKESPKVEEHPEEEEMGMSDDAEDDATGRKPRGQGRP